MPVIQERIEEEAEAFLEHDLLGLPRPSRPGTRAHRALVDRAISQRRPSDQDEPPY